MFCVLTVGRTQGSLARFCGWENPGWEGIKCDSQGPRAKPPRCQCVTVGEGRHCPRSPSFWGKPRTAAVTLSWMEGGAGHLAASRVGIVQCFSTLSALQSLLSNLCLKQLKLLQLLWAWEARAPSAGAPAPPGHQHGTHRAQLGKSVQPAATRTHGAQLGFCQEPLDHRLPFKTQALRLQVIGWDSRPSLPRKTPAPLIFPQTC